MNFQPHFDAKLETWLPYASIDWDGDKFHYHQLTDIEPAFKYEIEAMAYGFIFARTGSREMAQSRHINYAAFAQLDLRTGFEYTRRLDIRGRCRRHARKISGNAQTTTVIDAARR